MRRITLATGLPPGDICTLTAAVYSLHRQFPGQFETAIATSHRELWQHNPDVAPDGPGERIEVHYPAIGRSNQEPVCFLDGYRGFLAERLDLPEFRLLTNRPQLYLSDDERGWISQVHELTGLPTRFWLVSAGVKSDFPLKQWPIEHYQTVIDVLRGRVQFAQIGAAGDDHVRLCGVIDLVGRTDLRQLVRLVWHAAGGLGPVTLLQHLCAAWSKPYVCLLGGRESLPWAASYPMQTTLHTLGTLPCCREGACWRSIAVEAQRQNASQTACERPLLGMVRPVAECMAAIGPAEVAGVIERLDRLAR